MDSIFNSTESVNKSDTNYQQLTAFIYVIHFKEI